MFTAYSFSDAAQQALHIAARLAADGMHATYGPAHLLKALLHAQLPVRRSLEKRGVDVYYMEEWADIRMEGYPKAVRRSGEPEADEACVAVFNEAERLGDPVEPMHLLNVLAMPGVGFTREQLKSFPALGEEGKVNGVAGVSGMTVASTPFVSDRLAAARRGELAPVTGRDSEIRQMCEILSRKNKSNVLIVGDAGVGKTALMDGLVLAAMAGQLPGHLEGIGIYLLDNNALFAGATYKGEIEDRLNRVLKDMTGILLVDELQLFVGVASVLKAARVKMVATITVEEYRKTLSKDESLSRRFEVLQLAEPDRTTAEEMLRSHGDGLQRHHGLEIAETVFPEAIKLAKRYSKDRRLPDSAIDLVDRTMAAARMEKKTLVDVADTTAVMSAITGIPLGRIQAGEQQRLTNMEDQLRQRVVGQDLALKAVADAIVESRSGLNKAGQPIASFFFLGPTGTGKTEVAKSLAEFLFQDEQAMIRFDMSEFKEEHSAALLYGAPPGYVGYEEGGLLVNKIRQQPYSIVLFDEIEKAHPSVFDLFLQILDEGRMHDRLGKEGDFSNAVILFTSNIGAEEIVRDFNNGRVPAAAALMERMARHFRPEFLGRVTEIVPFGPVTAENIRRIFYIHLRPLTEQLAHLGVTLVVDEGAAAWLADKGFTPQYGVRPLKGVIRSELRKPLSRMIVNGMIGNGDTVTVRIDEDRVTFKTI